MGFCNSVWSAAWSAGSESRRASQDYVKILLQGPPQLIRVLHAYRFASHHKDTLFNIHLVLDLSWDELRRSICHLRSIIGPNANEVLEVFWAASNLAFSQGLRDGSMFRDLAHGYLSVMKSMLAHKFPPCFRQVFFFVILLVSDIVGRKCLWPNTLGRVLRLCQHDDDLLQDLRQLNFASADGPVFDNFWPDDWHHIVQWLKVIFNSSRKYIIHFFFFSQTFDNPPLDLIATFKYQLDRSNRNWPGLRNTFDDFEEKWMFWGKYVRKYVLCEVEDLVQVPLDNTVIFRPGAPTLV
jgi:hypothetical protein